MSRKSSESGLVWRKDEKDAIRRHHAPLFAAWKRAWGQERRDPVDWIPGFRESLQSLLDQGYTVTDVGVFLGLTGERVRQYAREYGLDRVAVGSTMRRVWDDRLMRFRPVTHDEYRAIVTAARRARRARELAGRREAVRQAIRDFATEHGRPPIMQELAPMFFPESAQPSPPMRMWLVGGVIGDYSPSSTRILDQLYADCGYVRPDGRATGKKWNP